MHVIRTASASILLILIALQTTAQKPLDSSKTSDSYVGSDSIKDYLNNCCIYAQYLHVNDSINRLEIDSLEKQITLYEVAAKECDRVIQEADIMRDGYEAAIRYERKRFRKEKLRKVAAYSVAGAEAIGIGYLLLRP